MVYFMLVWCVYNFIGIPTVNPIAIKQEFGNLFKEGAVETQHEFKEHEFKELRRMYHYLDDVG